MYLFLNENMFGGLKAIHHTFQKDGGENSRTRTMPPLIMLV
jgi:hypothetical protein